MNDSSWGGRPTIAAPADTDRNWEAIVEECCLAWELRGSGCAGRRVSVGRRSWGGVWTQHSALRPEPDEYSMNSLHLQESAAEATGKHSQGHGV